MFRLYSFSTVFQLCFPAKWTLINNVEIGEKCDTFHRDGALILRFSHLDNKL